MPYHHFEYCQGTQSSENSWRPSDVPNHEESEALAWCYVLHYRSAWSWSQSEHEFSMDFGLFKKTPQTQLSYDGTFSYGYI